MKQTVFIIAVFLVLLGFQSFIFSDDDDELTEQELVQLLVEGHEYWNRKKVFSYGIKLRPALEAILGNTAYHQMVITRSLLVVREAKISSPGILESVRNLLAHDDQWIRGDSLLALSKIGDYSDCKYIIPLLTDEVVTVRSIAAYALASLGDEKTAGEIKRILDERKSGKSEDEILKDASFRRGYKAVKQLLKKKEHSVLFNKSKGLLESREKLCGKLHKVLKDAEELVQVRLAAANILGNMRYDKALPDLAKWVYLLNDDVPYDAEGKPEDYPFRTYPITRVLSDFGMSAIPHIANQYLEGNPVKNDLFDLVFRNKAVKGDICHYLKGRIPEEKDPKKKKLLEKLLSAIMVQAK